ncbi:MAG: hypothetical protein SWH61_12165 [Thermodesulfobacteriota bacterium]|nr:hypothetical protein [Thermodesulfobacteriota bacterium]
MNRDSLKKYLVRSFSTGILSSIGTAVITLCFIPLLMKNLGAANYGIWAFLAFFTGIAGLGDIGISKSLVIFLNDPEQKTRQRQFLGASLILGFILAACAACLVYFLFPIGFHSLKNNVLPDWQLDVLTHAGTILIFVTIMTSIMRAVQEARLAIDQVNIIFFLTTASRYVLVWWVTRLENNLGLACYASVLVSISGFLIQGFFAFKGYVKPAIPELQHLKSMLKKSIGFWGLSAINLTILPLNRYLVVIVGGGMVAHGIFDVGVKIALAARNGLSTLSIPLFGVFAEMGAQKPNLRRTSKIVNQISLTALLFYGLGNGLFLIIGKKISNTIMPGNSHELYLVTIILLAGVTFYGVAEPGMRALWVMGKIHICIISRLILILMNILLIFSLAGIVDFLRFPIAYSLSAFLSSLMLITASRIHLALVK